MKTTISIGLLFLCGFLIAQPYVEGGKTRHRFAQLNMGLESRVFPSWGTQKSTLLESGKLDLLAVTPSAEVRAIIGGSHFWGHADFYVSFTILNPIKSGFQGRVETGAKVYPWRLERNKVRPYLGISWLTTVYQQNKGGQLLQNRFPFLTGITYSLNNNHLELGAGYRFMTTFFGA